MKRYLLILERLAGILCWMEQTSIGLIFSVPAIKWVVAILGGLHFSVRATLVNGQYYDTNQTVSCTKSATLLVLTLTIN